MRLRLKKEPPFSVDISPLTPEFCAAKSAAEAGRRLLRCAGQSLPAEELFEFTEDGGDTLEIIGACEKIDCVGGAMAHGKLRVSGNVGNYAAANMRGGTLEVRGNAGDFCGHSMSGGRLIVHGNAGAFCGGAAGGAMQGMCGGEIFILGDTGERCGDHMRRGLIAVRGNAGDYCGSRMKAGTVIVSEQCGRFCGQGMHRGSIILRRPPADGVARTFIPQQGCFETEFLSLLSRHLQNLDTGFEPLPLPKRAQRCIGDRSTAGKGEILILTTNL